MSQQIYYLGDSQQVPDLTTPTYNIRYNTRGFDHPSSRVKLKKLKRWQVPQSVIDAIDGFPDGDFGTWIDTAVKDTIAEFMACPPPRPAVVWTQPYILVEPTIFETTVGWAASAYYPDTNQIRAVALYYQQNQSWLRHFKDLIKWEIENCIAWQLGLQPEPRTPNWPCDASRR